MANVVTNEETKAAAVCPNCGYCPNCGRANAQPVVIPYVPTPPTWPWRPYPVYPTITWQTTQTNGTAVADLSNVVTIQ